MSQQKPAAAKAVRRGHAALREIYDELATYPALLTLIEMRIILRLSDPQARKLIHTGQLSSIRQGARVMVTRAEVLRYLQAGVR
jgi:hypothetical protein